MQEKKKATIKKTTLEHVSFMEKTLDLARLSLDRGEFPVGCLIVSHGEVIASGHRKNTTTRSTNELDHAEILALRDLFKSGRMNSVDPGEATLYCNLEPCMMCYGAIILSGIRHIVYAYEDVMGGGTSIPLAGLPLLYRDSEIKLESGVLREKSIGIFKEFFSDKNNGYWEKSLLATYTLSL